MSRTTTLYINKESHKFSAAHFTIFDAKDRERLHGHNYSLSARIVAPMGNNGFSADYNVYKTKIQKICDDLDEYLLLAGQSPFLRITEQGENYQVQYDQDSMTFLKKDTLVLPIVNVTIEELSSYCLDLLVDASGEQDITEIELFVSSGAGQKASTIWTAQ